MRHNTSGRPPQKQAVDDTIKKIINNRSEKNKMNKTDFKNVLQGKTTPTLTQNAIDGDYYKLPEGVSDEYNSKLKKYSLFRRHATVNSINASEGKIYIPSISYTASWIDENESIPKSIENLTAIPLNSKKLATMIKVKCNIVEDELFNLTDYLINTFARCFGQAEDNAYLNGNGVKTPTGILTEGGATVGAVTESTTLISFEDLQALYYSVPTEYRENAVFIMHDNTAMQLRTLTDANGYPLINQDNNTLFGKPVETSAGMPECAAGAKAVVFGDLSYYSIIERQPLAVKCLTELYINNSEYGYIGTERLDGKLTNKNAVKVLKMND